MCQAPDLHGVQHGRVLASPSKLLQVWVVSWHRAVGPNEVQVKAQVGL